MKISQIAIVISSVGFFNFILGYVGMEFTGEFFVGNVLGGLFLYFVGLIIEDKQDAKRSENAQ